MPQSQLEMWKREKGVILVRAEGEFQNPDQIKNVVLISENQENNRFGRVTVADIGDVRFTHKEPTSNIRFLGDSSIAINAVRQSGANVIEIMAGIREAIKELNEDILPNLGLKIEQVYDETIYIDSAIELVRQNIWIGGSLAVNYFATISSFLESNSDYRIVYSYIRCSSFCSYGSTRKIHKRNNHWRE